MWQWYTRNPPKYYNLNFISSVYDGNTETSNLTPIKVSYDKNETTQFFSQKVSSKYYNISLIFLVYKIYENCNLTPQMVSYDKINITKIFVLKSYPKSCVLILMCRSIRKIPKICNVTPQMVSNDKICHFQVFPCEK